MKFSRLQKIISFFVMLMGFSSQLLAADKSLDNLVNSMGELEDKNDPKCYATASRLEDFIYGTPLTDEARFGKIDLQKNVILSVWEEASKQAMQSGKQTITPEVLNPTLNSRLKIKQEKQGDWVVFLAPPMPAIHIDEDSQRQYSSIAYSIRAILAVQQDSLLSGVILLPLDDSAIELFGLFVDLYTLASLQVADVRARHLDKYEVDLALFDQAWTAVSLGVKSNYEPDGSKVADVNVASEHGFTMMHKIIASKIDSYQAYNQISNKVFLRNVQVYFARTTWPSDADEGANFKKTFNDMMTSFAQQLYQGAEGVAKEKNNQIIRVADLGAFAAVLMPHEINEYEDAHFFPRLVFKEQIHIESYDMDAFRDSGMHWRYLQWLIEDPVVGLELPLDPFSTELLVENVAQFGVLLLRVAGSVAKQKEDKFLKTEYLHLAINIIQEKISANAAVKDMKNEEQQLASSSAGSSVVVKGALFNEISSDVGMQFEHRTADWLSRLIRSYSMKDESTGVLDIPPAFGGSGVAAEDINNDGFVDYMILSGRGNKLYLNNGVGGFDDVTKRSGLAWLRADNTSGEVRQPLIADFDNDGLQDVLITYVNDKHRIYKNMGGVQFKDVTDSAGLGGEGLVGGPATVFDMNNDGLLDVYIAYFGDYVQGILPTLVRKNTNGLANKMFINTGGFVFEEVTEAVGAGDTGWGQAITHTDFNADGWQDVIVGNDFGVNVYYKNIDGKRFENVANQMGTGKPSFTMGIGISDINDDDYPDIYISNIVTMNKDQKYVSPNKDTPASFNPEKLAAMRIVEANDLFISSMVKEEEISLPQYELSKAVGRGYSSTGWSWGADFFDFDNDADDDLYVVNGMNEYSVYSDEAYEEKGGYGNDREIFMPVASKETNVFFINDQGKLNNASTNSGLDVLINSRSAAYLDYDNDGDLDIVLNNFHERAMFFRNNAEQLNHHSFSLRLIGSVKNKTSRDAIGAKIIATLPDGNKVWREVRGSGGYLTVHPKEQHFGLGKHEMADLEIFWPNGDRQILHGVKAGERYVLHQGANLEQLKQPEKQLMTSSY